MKLLVSTCIVFLAALGLGIWANHSIAKNTEVMLENIGSISQAVAQEKWDIALQETENLKKGWKKNAKWWPTLIDHQEMDNIEFSLARCEEYISYQHLPLAQSQVSELKAMLEHIPEREAVSLQNIF